MNFTSTTQNAAATISNMWRERVELLLLTELEKIEGRVPSDEEVSKYAHCLMHADGRREYLWRGKCVLRVDSWLVNAANKFVLNYSTPKT